MTWDNKTNRVFWTIKKGKWCKCTNGVDEAQSMFILTIIETIKETRLNFSQGKCNSLINNDKLSRNES